MSYRADVAIIGAGVVGLGVAAQAVDKGWEVYLLEKNETFGRETSSRHSGVIHSGIYYPEGSLKAKTCVAGNKLLYELCENSGIAYRKCGKMIIATNEKEVDALETLYHRGKGNGVPLKILSDRETAGIFKPLDNIIVEGKRFFRDYYNIVSKGYRGIQSYHHKYCQGQEKKYRTFPHTYSGLSFNKKIFLALALFSWSPSAYS